MRSMRFARGQRSFFAVVIAGSVLLTTVLTNTTPAMAATAATGQGTKGTGNGLKISPVRSDLTIEKGTGRQVSLFVENITSFPITMRAVINDFVPASDESGEPRIILDDSQRAPGNSFKSLISAVPSVELAAGQRKEVKVTLSVPANASSGGYYGAVRFAPSTGENDKNVALTASAGSIFLVRVPGNITEKLSIESFSIKPYTCTADQTKPATSTAVDTCKAKYGNAGSLFSHGPLAVETRFRNFGNIHVQPFGKIYIKNFSGKIVETIEINNAQPRGSVLPASIRKFNNNVQQQKYFGKYTAEGSFGYGTTGELLLAKKTFYVIPYKLIAAIIAIILIMTFGLPRLIRRYNESIIRHARQTNKAKQKRQKTRK